MLTANEGKPSRERLTLIRIFEELRCRGYESGYDAVRRYARARTFAPLREFPHVTFCVDKGLSSALPDEEIACDTYARAFMASGLAA